MRAISDERRSFVARSGCPSTKTDGAATRVDATRSRLAFIRPAFVSGVQRLGKGLIALAMVDGTTGAVGPNYTKTVLAGLKLEQPRTCWAAPLHIAPAWNSARLSPSDKAKVAGRLPSSGL
jgi:hypothetical protein